MSKKLTEEELRRKFPDISALADQLIRLPEIDVRFNGTGVTAFKVYLSSEYLKCDDDEGWFLEIHTPSGDHKTGRWNRSIVSWSGQKEYKEACRTAFARLVKNARSDHFSYIEEHVDDDDVVAAADEYVSTVLAASS